MNQCGLFEGAEGQGMSREGNLVGLSLPTRYLGGFARVGTVKQREWLPYRDDDA